MVFAAADIPGPPFVTTLDRDQVRTVTNCYEHDSRFFIDPDHGEMSVAASRSSGDTVPRFQPFTPSQAVDVIKRAGIADAHRLILDYAAAGHLRAEALVMETTAPDAERTEVHAAIPKDLWKRVIQEDAETDVWPGGTVRLSASNASDGLPAVNLTCIRFEVLDIYRLIRSQGGGLPAGMTSRPAPSQTLAPPEDGVVTSAPTPASTKSRKRRSADMSVIPTGALLISVADMMAALGIGRTKAYELINSGKVERREVDGAVRITVASVNALAGVDD